MNTSPKRLLSLAGLLLLAVPFLHAADEPAGAPPGDGPKHERRGPGGPGAMMQHAVKELGLSAEQEAKWKEIGQQERAARQALGADTAVAKEDKRAKLKEINKGFADQRRALLNAEQQAKFDEMRAKMHERGERGPRGPKPDKDN
jgi:Spy/CpxP family protein refolding chaperone